MLTAGAMRRSIAASIALASLMASPLAWADEPNPTNSPPPPPAVTATPPVASSPPAPPAPVAPLLPQDPPPNTSRDYFALGGLLVALGATSVTAGAVLMGVAAKGHSGSGFFPDFSGTGEFIGGVAALVLGVAVAIPGVVVLKLAADKQSAQKPVSTPPVPAPKLSLGPSGVSVQMAF